jgi:hypothetical protein
MIKLLHLSNQCKVRRFLNILLLCTVQLGYLEWGRGSTAFVYRVSLELVMSAVKKPGSFLHPIILVPLIGEILLLITIFQKTPGRILTLIGLCCLSVLMLLLFFIGAITHNGKILLSALPFIITGILVLRYNWKRKPVPRRLGKI